jgi:hypothetical protein
LIREGFIFGKQPECALSGSEFKIKTIFIKEGFIMPRGDKDKYTDKQKRQAEHIEEGYEKKGVSEKEAEKRAWATVNKQDGGGKKGGSGGKKKD